ncbi:hypothetical protein Trco_001506 [Trichoderma cornu-damae]|uniref:DUF6603 domain-containing protein n=1 Tax=Trichoderma cornu-damae TaxID=654480 RepID=A0A9P8QSG3_9HYPO|nr:hypothetical protein Trco_001506 [Trichoderma cornu-damae]
MTSKDIIESFHINVGLGDSAIHVLCTETLEFKKAVFIDGGTGAADAVTNIIGTIKQLEKRYGLDKKKLKLRFIAVVITHWDEDHWKGIDVLLQRENHLVFLGQYMRFYYEGKDMLTTVYAPNIPNNKGNISFYKAGAAYYFRHNGSCLANARVGPDIIGYDFLTNTKPAGKLSRDKITMDSLLGDDPEPVGMYCLASDRAVIGFNTRPRKRALGQREFIYNVLPTKTNQESIAAIIVWANKHISHYFAGDLDFWGEDLISIWLEKNMVDNGTYGITCMKSSHHGARNSNPPLLFYTAWETLCMLYSYLEFIRKKDANEPLYPPWLFTCYPYWLAGMHQFDAFPAQKINVDVFKTNKDLKKLSQARQKAATNLTKLYEELKKDHLNQDDSLFDEIRTACYEANATTEEEIFEEVSIAFVTKASSMIADLWQWDLDTGTTLDSVMYIMLRLTDNADTDGTVDFSRYGNGDQSRALEFVELDRPKKNSAIRVHGKKIKKKSRNRQSEMAAGAKPLGMLTRSRKRQLTASKGILVPKRYWLRNRKSPSDNFRLLASFQGAGLVASSTTRPGPPSPRGDSSALTSASTSTSAVQFPYSILSSSAEGQEQLADHTVLQPDDWLDDFVLSLQTGAIRLASTLKDDAWTPLHQDDEMAGWIGAAFHESTMEINSYGPEFRLTTPYGFVFRTSAAAKALGTEAQISCDGLSLWSENGTLLFGLDPECKPSKTSWTTSEVVAMFPTKTGKPLEPLELTASLVSDVLLDLRWKLDPAASAGKRNAIWFTAAARSRTILRLVFIPELGDSTPFRSLLAQFLPSSSDGEAIFSVSNVELIYRKTCVAKSAGPAKTTMAATRSLTLSATITVLGPKSVTPGGQRAKASPTISLELISTGAMSLHIVTTDREDSFTGVARGWLAKLFPGSDGSTQIDTLDAPDMGSNLWFRRLVIQLDPDKSISRAAVAVEVNARLGSGKDEKSGQATNVPIFFEAQYSKTAVEAEWSLAGNLWLKSEAGFPYEIFSDYERFYNLDPVTPNPAGSLRLTTLFSSLAGGQSIPDPPPGIPNVITAAGFRIDSSSIFVSGTISGCRPEQKGPVPALQLDELSLEASWNRATKGVRVALAFRLHLAVPEDYDGPDACAANAINGSIVYESGGQWEITAGIQDLNLGMLYTFFPENVRDSLYQLLKGIRIVDLKLIYHKTKTDGGTEKDLTCEGRLMLGDAVSLQLTYNYRSDGSWDLAASLGAEVVAEPVTLGDIMDSLVDPADTSLLSALPDFLADAVILGRQDLDPKFELKVDKSKDHGPKLSVKASVLGLEVEFVQLVDKKKATTATSQVGKVGDPPAESKGKVLRLFKAMLTRIPMPKDIPILAKMEQPFEELGFIWVNQAVTQDQLVALDDSIALPKEQGREATGPAAAAVMNRGFHFVIVAKHKVVLDYPIGKARSGERPTDAGDEPPKEDVDPPEPKPPGPEKGDKMEPSQSNKSKYKRNLGTLAISNIGFRYDGNTLAILMDAAIAFGPVALDLMGFTLGLRFVKDNGAKTNLQSLEWQDAAVSIDGLGIQLERPPLTIAGALLREKSADTDMYAGALTVGFTQWLVQAAGFYGVMGKQGDPRRFKTLFACAMLRGPIMNIAGFAEISGLTGAFGYNIDLTLPTLQNIASFPLLSPSSVGDGEGGPVGPAQLVEKLLPRPGERGPFFNPQDGAMFAAAGLTVTAFQMLEITALVAMQWAPRVQVALIGLAKCDMPSAKAEFKFAHLELGILATVDIDAGLMKLEAQLSPSSWILHRNCHLTGGFALYFWFGGGQTDWVVSMGGYHRAYLVPAHYPRPERLRISWSIDSSLSIAGEAYFAVTPKVCMGGLRLRAALSLGALSAWFDASADFLITYAPFRFVGTVSISVGVRFSMDVWFVTVSIAVEVSARLALMGPPLSGIVHVDFWVFGFDIAFGDANGAEGGAAALSLPAFWDLVTQAESKSAEETGTKEAHLFSCTKGLLTQNKPETKAADPWLVRSGLFQFTVECQFAVESASVNDEPAKAPDPDKTTINGIYARPMQVTQSVESTLEVDIGKTDAARVKGWKATLAWKDVPTALWGQYNPTEDPNRPENGNYITALLSPGGMARLLMGVVIEAPEAKVSLDKIPQFLVDLAMRKNVFSGGQEPRFPPNEMDEGVFAPIPRDDPPPEDGKDPETRAQPWTDLRLAWEAAPAPNEAVDMWQDAFGWSAGSLTGAKPKNLISHVDVLFLSAPLLGNKYNTREIHG